MLHRILRAVFGPSNEAQCVAVLAISERLSKGESATDAERRFLAEWEARADRETQRARRAALVRINRWWR